MERVSGDNNIQPLENTVSRDFDRFIDNPKPMYAVTDDSLQILRGPPAPLPKSPYYSSSRQHAKVSVSEFSVHAGENLLRDLEMLRDRAEYFARQNRQLNTLNGVGFGQNKRFDSLSGVSFGGQKRNFDEIDRSGFDRFVKKNFDEIDRSGFDRFVKKNFDEIDRSAFSSFVKRPSKVAAANLE